MDDAILEIFAEEAIPLTAEIEQHLLAIERDTAAIADHWRSLLGAVHTLKGNCGMVGLLAGQELAHAIEQRARDVRGWSCDEQGRATADLLRAADRLRSSVVELDAAEGVSEETERLRGLPAAPVELPEVAEPAAPLAIEVRPVATTAPVSHLRVPAARLDRLLDAAADLGAWSERLQSALRAARRRSEAALADGAARRVADLREMVMELRLVPLSGVLGRFDRVIRDLSHATGKRVALEVHGGAINVDKHVADELGEPLLHVVQNAVGHGLESPRERSLAGKPEIGALLIEARVAGGVLELVVGDDGRGIDRGKVAAAARARGVDVDAWPAEQVLDLVFAADVSTAERVTTLSGRGIGLAQARRSLERVGESIRVTSEPGVGTWFHLRLPLVIAVQRSLLVRCDGEIYGIPFTAVLEVFRTAHESPPPSVPWRGLDLPACVLADELGAHRRAAPSTCVVVERRDAPLAVLVEGVVGHQELTVRELDPMFGRPPGVTGAAVLADGQIVPVLEFHSLGRRGAA